ncbi:MAG: histidinol phosphate phosphatase [Gemmatimonadota bacterium]|nr:histidinol phosphate phosphatase [Gemmatimonadota bacterium]MDE3171482.1 histidinol phosphate phosphatase [Gemmatimonadota bacterium]MDE3215079.1 histidinol phosphate phosphatase [Gemmatimonadota bacterium]
MTATPDLSLLDAVAELASIVGASALAHYRTDLRTEYKADGSPVTAADRGAEQAAREWLARRFPEDGVLGEEFGTLRPDAARQWIIDPIDGTKSFVRGIPLWGSLVAVCEGSRVLAGAAAYPALGEHLAAAPGQGCWWNAARCRVSDCANMGDATVLTTDERFLEHRERGARWRALAAGAAVARSWGDCVGYLLVATGRAEVMADPVLSAWDAAPFLPILAEAGGVFTDWSGVATIRGGSAIATNRRLAAVVRTALGCPVDPLLMETN